jgi:hypothetical protein
MMLLADMVGSVQCGDCRRKMAGVIRAELPNLLKQALKSPITSSDHLH